MRLNSFMSWIGGKKALRELIVTLFPVYYERYIEVFGGGGWVLFHKPPGNDFEVYNDFNSLLVNLYRCVRDKPQELMEALRYVLNSREDFDVVRATLARDSPASDVQKAAWFYELIRYSYAAGLTSFGSQPHDMWSNFPLIEQAHRRLAKVVIENKDFEKLIRQYDRPASLFYAQLSRWQRRVQGHLLPCHQRGPARVRQCCSRCLSAGPDPEPAGRKNCPGPYGPAGTGA